MKLISRNPATGEEIATYEQHTSVGIEESIRISWKAWQEWSATPMSERCDFLEELASVLEQNEATYSKLIVSEMGKPIAEAKMEITKAAACARHFAESANVYLGDSPIQGTPARVVYQSLGPIFGVMPWNLPFWQVLRFVIPTLLAGNVVLIKHAESVQGCARALEQLFLQAGAREGLYSNLAIRRDAVSKIVRDPRIRAVTVTGSVKAGRAIAADAGAVGKKVVLELGGSDPFIVFEDADFEGAVKFGVISRFFNNSQSCIAAKRIFVEENIYDKYCSAYVKATNALVVGDPLDPATNLGPLARADLCDETERQLHECKKAGATVLAGGYRIERPGNYFAPAVVVDLPHDAPIAREEFFGPIAVLYRFVGEDQVVALANDCEFGLGASVWSSDAERAERVALQLEAGAVFINDFVKSDPRAPFGGVKGSGFGRELGGHGARELTNAKLVWVAET